MNNEAKIRRSTKSLVLGKARVVSYEDLVEARAERAKKEAAQKEGQNDRRDRKRKNNASEADSPPRNAKTTRMTEAVEPARDLERTGDMSGKENVFELEFPRAPVARMY